MRVFFRFWIVGNFFFSLIRQAAAEIRPLELLLEPNDQEVVYTNGYIRAPGYINLRNLTFEATAESYIGLGDDMVDENDGVDSPPRMLFGQTYDGRNNLNNELYYRQLDEGGYKVDVVIFRLPDQCAKKKNGCDWTQLGIGAKKVAKKGEILLKWCCSQDAIDNKMCTYEQKGRLILQSNDNGTDTPFRGEKRSIDIPATGSSMQNLRVAYFQETNSGRYVVLFANCDIDGRQVRVTGFSIWESVHGFLPGELYGFMLFYAGLIWVYLLLTIWYGLLMQRNKESRIPIEKWILMTMVLGLCEMFFSTCAYLKWNNSGYRALFLDFSSLTLGVLKRGISRVLMVMVALGWGVIRDSLGSTLNTVVVLGASYIGISAFRELMEDIYKEDVSKLTEEEGEELADFVTILTFIEAAIDVVFILWILDALNGTMEYLENMSQLRKLQRYLSLRSILLFAILFATIFVVFQLVDSYDENGIVQEEHVWVVEAAFEVNYVLVLFGIAYLWRPNPSAREYAYVMELPASGGANGETELELSGVVPSAMDDDDDNDLGPAVGSPAKQERNDHDDRFKIDEAEAA